MKCMNIGRRLVCAMLYLSSFSGHAQNEATRADDWLTLQRLKTLASLDSSFLSSADKTKLFALLVDRSPSAVCSRVSTSPCLSAPLPIKGLKLSGRRSSPATARLNWETKAEYNSKRFVLERQSPSDASVYDSVYATAGQGNTLATTKYGYTDLNGYKLVTYYRVREIDIDDSATYSNIVAIGAAASGLSVYVAPNPGSASTAALYIEGTSASVTGFFITNADGRTIARQENVPLSGNTRIALGGYHLAKGFYIVTVYNQQEQISQKFIII
jgi:hypothetical protein